MKSPEPSSFAWTDFLVFAPFALAALSLLLFASHPDDENSKGIRAFKKKDYSSAAASFSRAIGQAVDKNYLNGEASLNLGLAYDKAGAPLKALKAYLFVSENFDGERKIFESLFNQGELNGRLGRTEEALLKYQKALDFAAEAQKIKENIEALFLSEKEKAGGGGQSDPPDPAKKAEGQKNSEAGSGRKREAEEERDSRENPARQSGGQEDEARGQNQEPETGNADKKLSGGEDGKPKLKNEEEAPQDPGGGEEAASKEDGKGAANPQENAAAPPPPQDKTGKSRAGAFEEAAARAILDSLEKQEADVRKRLYQQKSLQKKSRPRRGKDW